MYPTTFTKKQWGEICQKYNIVSQKFHESRVVAKDPESGLFYHLDRLFQPVSDRRFAELDDFHEGAARAKDDSGCFHVDLFDQPLYEESWSDVGRSNCGIAWAKIGGKYCHIKVHSGQPIYPLGTWLKVGDMIDGFALVTTEEGKELYIDVSGRVVCEEETVPPPDPPRPEDPTGFRPKAKNKGTR